MNGTSAKQECGVTLVPIGRPGETGAFDRSWAHDVWEKFQQRFPDTSIDWWVGHDVTSGEAALKGPEVAGAGRTALIMHMRYLQYQAVKHGNAVGRRSKRTASNGTFSVQPARRGCSRSGLCCATNLPRWSARLT